VISYPTQADTKAERRPVPQNARAAMVDHRKTVSQNGAVNDGIALPLIAFIYFVVCLLISVAGGIIVTIKKSRRRQSKSEIG
jgi:hypothetical protein